MSGDPMWDQASRTLRAIAKMARWKVRYYGKTKNGQRWWMLLEPPPASIHRGPKSTVLGYRRGDGFMRRGSFYALMVHYDQQERVPIEEATP